jgi:hypothetical protein
MRSDTKRWITEEEDILRQAALAGTSVAEIASVVGRTESAVRARAYILGCCYVPVGIRRRGSVWQSAVSEVTHAAPIFGLAPRGLEAGTAGRQTKQVNRVGQFSAVPAYRVI